MPDDAFHHWAGIDIASQPGSAASAQLGLLLRDTTPSETGPLCCNIELALIKQACYCPSSKSSLQALLPVRPKVGAGC